VIVGLAVFALLFIVRPLLSKVATAGPAPTPKMMAAAALVKAMEPGKPLKTIADIEGEIEAQLDANVSDKDRRLPVAPPLSQPRCPPVCPPFTDSCGQDGNNCSTYGYDGISHQRIRNYPCQAARGATADEKGGY